MAFVHKPGFGILFNNNRKTADNQPDMQGEIRLPDGTLMRIAGWRRDGAHGAFYSLKLSEVQYQKPAPAEEPPDEPRPAEATDDMPF